MKSGLEGRNNPDDDDNSGSIEVVSMKSGLEGRNNPTASCMPSLIPAGLNEVRPRRPEQSKRRRIDGALVRPVSMKSGLEGRNNGLGPFRVCRS